MPLITRTPKLMLAVAAQIPNLRGQEAPAPAHIRPMKGSNKTVAGLIPMDSVTSRMPNSGRLVAAK
jgi:hypothetical protein